VLAPRAFGFEHSNLLLNGVDGPPAPSLLPGPLHACFPRGPAQRSYRRRVRAERHRLLLPVDIKMTGFSRRRHKITFIRTIVYDTAVRAEREHCCFNVFCAEQTRSRDAVTLMKLG